MSSKVNWKKPIVYVNLEGEERPARVVCTDVKDGKEGTVVASMYEKYDDYEYMVYTDHNGCTLGRKIQVIFNKP